MIARLWDEDPLARIPQHECDLLWFTNERTTLAAARRGSSAE